jgi:DNA primase
MKNEKTILDFYDEIINKCDLVEIIGRYVPLKKKGANYVGLCPFHSDTNASLSVSPTKKIWKCFVCPNAAGNVIGFVSKYEKISYLEAAKKIAQIINLNVNDWLKNHNSKINNPRLKFIYDINQHVAKYYEMFLYDKKNQNALDYLLKRGLTKEVCQHFHLGYAPKQHEIMYHICTNHQQMFGLDYDQNLV